MKTSFFKYRTRLHVPILLVFCFGESYSTCSHSTSPWIVQPTRWFLHNARPDLKLLFYWGIIETICPHWTGLGPKFVFVFVLFHYSWPLNHFIVLENWRTTLGLPGCALQSVKTLTNINWHTLDGFLIPVQLHVNRFLKVIKLGAIKSPMTWQWVITIINRVAWKVKGLIINRSVRLVSHARLKVP